MRYSYAPLFYVPHTRTIGVEINVTSHSFFKPFSFCNHFMAPLWIFSNEFWPEQICQLNKFRSEHTLFLKSLNFDYGFNMEQGVSRRLLVLSSLRGLSKQISSSFKTRLDGPRGEFQRLPYCPAVCCRPASCPASPPASLAGSWLESALISW